MTEPTSLAHVAGLFGRLLLFEIDAEMLRVLQSKEVAAAWRTLELRTPQLEELEELAAEYCAAFLGPQDPTPLIQSLYEGDGHEAPSANAVREIAALAKLELDREESRAAAPDHLGAILMLWAELANSWPEGAALLAQSHMNWAQAPLHTLAARGGFYGELSAAIASTIGAIRDPDGDDRRGDRPETSGPPIRETHPIQ